MAATRFHQERLQRFPTGLPQRGAGSVDNLFHRPNPRQADLVNPPRSALLELNGRGWG